jgi:putative ABC transport system permease protein
VSTLLQDLRQAVRVLLQHPGYLATALMTLALGIGFSTATFSVVNAVLLRPLPYANPEQLLILRERNLPNFPQFSVSPGHYLWWCEQATLFDGIAAWGSNLRNIDTGNGEPERIRADRVSANLFQLLGVSPALGRAFTEEDDAANAAPVVMLSHGAWQRRFGGSDVLGQTIRMDRQAVTIVGVMPATFVFPAADTEMWMPMAMPAAERQRHGSHYLSVVARMKSGVTFERAQADLAAAAKRLEQAMPDGNNIGWEVLAYPMHEYSVRTVRGALVVLFGAVSLVLLIACVNVANLLLARGASRQKELAIRAAIGASRGRLVRQLFIEQVTLATPSAAAGVLVAAWLLRSLLALLPDAMPRQADIKLDGQVLGFAVVLVFLTPLIFGLFPALQASRPDLRDLLAATGRQGSSAPTRRVRRALVVAEIALALVLLVGAGLMIRSFGNLASVSPGFASEAAVTVNINLPSERYAEGEPREQFFDQVLSRAGGLPQAVAVGLTQSVPMVNDFVSPFQNRRPTIRGWQRSHDEFLRCQSGILRGNEDTSAARPRFHG